MPIESEFQHRGYSIRLKYRGVYDGKHLYHLFILTETGPYFVTASSIFEAKMKAVELINGFTSGDWTLSTPAVQREVSNRDDIGRVSSIRGGKTEETPQHSASSAQSS